MINIWLAYIHFILMLIWWYNIQVISRPWRITIFLINKNSKPKKEFWEWLYQKHKSIPLFLRFPSLLYCVEFQTLLIKSFKVCLKGKYLIFCMTSSWFYALISEYVGNNLYRNMVVDTFLHFQVIFTPCLIGQNFAVTSTF